MALASVTLGSICSSATHSLGDWTIYFPSMKPMPSMQPDLLNAGCCYQGPWSESGLTREITVLR